MDVGASLSDRVATRASARLVDNAITPMSQQERPAKGAVMTVRYSLPRAKYTIVKMSRARRSRPRRTARAPGASSKDPDPSPPAEREVPV